MSLLVYDKKEIKRRIEALPHQKRIAFGASCCERLLRNYSAFKSESGWGDIGMLRLALDKVWACTLGDSVPHDEIVKLITDCENVAPDSDDFESLFTSSAQDFVFSICSVLDYIADGDTVKLVQSSSYPIDSVDLYVQENEDMLANSPDLEEQIRRHPLMQREIEQQHSALLLLEQTGSVEELRERSQTLMKSNLDL